MKNAQYWKVYRSKNSARLNAKKRARYRAKVGKQALTIPNPIPNTIIRKCQYAYCPTPGKEVLINGLKAWLCDEHKPKA